MRTVVITQLPIDQRYDSRIKVASRSPYWPLDYTALNQLVHLVLGQILAGLGIAILRVYGELVIFT